MFMHDAQRDTTELAIPKQDEDYALDKQSPLKSKPPKPFKGNQPVAFRPIESMKSNSRSSSANRYKHQINEEEKMSEGENDG